MKKRAQAAMEYLLVGAMVTLVIIPTMYIFYGYSQRSNEEVRQSQLNKVGTDIVDVAEQVYYLGEPSKVTIDEVMPEGIIGIEVWRNKEVVFFLQDGSEIAFKSKVNITTNKHCIGRCYGNFTERFYSPGLKNIIIEAKKDHVFIREEDDNQIDQEDIEEDVIYCDNDEDDYFSDHESESCDQPWILSSPDPGIDCNDNNKDICPNEILCPELCNGTDDDCDGEIDEGFTNETCSYVCDDNNYEWLETFCCGNDPGEGSPYESPEETCYDGNDNDCNGLFDCKDPSCDGSDCDEYLSSICIEEECIPTEEDCITPNDDDFDGLINCEDTDTDDCPLEASCCPIGEICEEGTMTCQETVYGGRECRFSPYPPYPPIPPCVDIDEDGYGVCPDCNIEKGCEYDGNDCCDEDPLVHPGAEYQYIISAACDTWDYNCSGEIEKFGEDGSASFDVTSCTTTMPGGNGGWVEPTPHVCGVYYTQRYCIDYINDDCTGEKHAFYYQPCYQEPYDCGSKYGICFIPNSWEIIEQSAPQWCR